jgi:hypothetical protein
MPLIFESCGQKAEYMAKGIQIGCIPDYLGSPNKFWKTIVLKAQSNG